MPRRYDDRRGRRGRRNHSFDPWSASPASGPRDTCFRPRDRYASPPPRGESYCSRPEGYTYHNGFYKPSSRRLNRSGYSENRTGDDTVDGYEGYGLANEEPNLLSRTSVENCGSGSNNCEYHRPRARRRRASPRRGHIRSSREPIVYTTAPGATSSHGIAFSTAAEKLGDITDRAIRFFDVFQSGFNHEIESILGYAHRDTMNEIWKNKILRNEKYLGKPKTSYKQDIKGKSRQRGRHRDRSIQRDGDRDQDQNQHQSSGWDQTNNGDWSAENLGNGNTKENTDTNARHSDNRARVRSHSSSSQPRNGLSTFNIIQTQLHDSIIHLLRSQILPPRLRPRPKATRFRDRSTSNSVPYSSSEESNEDRDDYTSLEDLLDQDTYSNACVLRKRVDHCKDDLLPLLNKVRADYQCMGRLLVELNCLKRLLDVYSRKDEREGSWTNQDE